MRKIISLSFLASALLLPAACGGALEIDDEAGGDEGALVSAVTERDRIELVLFDSRRDKALRSLGSQATLDRAKDGTKLNIEARSSDGSVKKFRFDLDGGALKTTEQNAPYVMAGHDDDDYHDWTPSLGQHTLVVKGYDSSGKTVRARTVQIDVIDSDDALELVLLDAARDRDLRSLSDGSTIDLDRDGSRLNIAARTSDARVDRVEFSLNDGEIEATERHAPYIMAGHNGADYSNWRPDLGRHVLKVTARDRAGKSIASRAIDLEVIDSGTGEGDSGTPRVILDTDFGFDVDDVGALALLHALADKGEVQIVAVNSVVRDLYSPGAIDAINTYYGRPNTPIGQNKNGPKKWELAAPYWGSYGRYNKYLDQHYSNDETGSSVPSAVRNYRSVLARQPDKSVSIAVVGFTQNMAELLRSKPDQHSSLSGKQLVAKKVKEVIVMGGPGNGHFNLTGGPDKDGTDTAYFLTHWPTVIKFQDGSVCGGVKTGSSLRTNNPVGKAYQLFLGRSGRNRPSWDQCTVLQAVRGNKHGGKTYFREIPGKTLRMDGLNAKLVSGTNVMVKRVISQGEMTAIIEDLMNNPPTRK